MAESAPFDFAPLTRSYAQDERYRGVLIPSVSWSPNPVGAVRLNPVAVS